MFGDRTGSACDCRRSAPSTTWATTSPRRPSATSPKNSTGARSPICTSSTPVAAIEKGIEPYPGALRMLELMRERYRGTFIIAGGFDHDTAEGWLQQGKADLI